MNRNIKTIGKVIIFMFSVLALVSFVFCITYEIENIVVKLISLLSGTWLGTIILVNFVCNLIEDEKEKK